MTMPPLPVPTKFTHLIRDIKFFGADAYTETQLKEYAAAVRAATIEECAKVCDSHENDWRAISAWESSHSARDCAAAIRALISSPAR